MGRNGEPLDVLLINLPDPRRQNLGLGYLASTLRLQGRRVEIFEPRSSPGAPGDKESVYVPQVLQKEFTILGISLYTPGAEEAAHLVQTVRSRRPGTHISLGGNFPTVAFRKIIKDPDFRGVDSVVLCEGDRTFEELVGRICEGAEWRDVEGIAFRSDGRALSTPARMLQENLDELPFPVRVGACVETETFGYEVRLCSSRGCYANCSFCGVRAFYDESRGTCWRGRSPQNVADEMEYFVRTMDVHTFEFVDDDFLGLGKRGRTRARGIAREIERRKLRVTFSISCRVNDVDWETITELKRAGLDCVFLGIESGTQRGLDVFNKGITVRESEEALIMLRKLQLRVRVGFIFFFPQMTLQDVIENLNFLEKIIRWGAEPDSGGFNALQVYHRTPIQYTLKELGLLRGNYRGYEYDFADPDVALLCAFMQRPWYHTFLDIYKSFAGPAGVAVRRAIAEDWTAYACKLRNFLLRACRRAVFRLRAAEHTAEKNVRLDELAQKLEAELTTIHSNIKRIREVVCVG